MQTMEMANRQWTIPLPALPDGQVSLPGMQGTCAAWKTAPRDQFIGWDPTVRKQNLRLITIQATLDFLFCRGFGFHILPALF
jgi:hypothetical protein